MSLLIKNATIVDVNSSLHLQNKDLLIEKGIIKEINDNIDSDDHQVIEGHELILMSGFVDMLADYCDPGYEYKETIQSGSRAAKKGGFQQVALMPNTQPGIVNKGLVDYVLQQGKSADVHIHVLGAITKDLEGKDLAEMWDMYHAGAIAFTDGWKPVQNAQLLLKALEYIKAFDGLIIQIPIHAELSKGSLMNESELSVQLGLAGVPDMAESLMIYRDIQLLNYTGSRLHFAGVSTKASLELIRQAKAQGLRVTCSVTPYHLLFSEANLFQYNSQFKTDPPLRSEEDRQALIEGLLDGTIDAVSSHHQPQDWDAKVKELEYAAYGMASQEVMVAMLLKAAPEVSWEKWSELLSTNPAKIYKLSLNSIAVGSAVHDFTLIDAKAEYSVNPPFESLAYNLPLKGETVIGKVISQ